MEENISKDIWKLFQSSPIPFKWRFEVNSIKTINKGTSFRVNTDYIVGLVKITQESEQTYTVIIKPDNYGGSFIYEHIIPQNLISQISQVLLQGVIVDNRESQNYRIAI